MSNYKSYDVLWKQKSKLTSKATITNNLCKPMLAIESNYQKNFFYPLEAPGVVSQEQAASLLINSPYFEDLGGSYFRLKKEKVPLKPLFQF